jgi:hypothetical protein
MNITINSRKHGPQTFWAKASDGSSFVYLQDGEPGTRGSQICEGGGMRGATVMCNGTRKGLEREAKKWWRQYMRKSRQWG